MSDLAIANLVTGAVTVSTLVIGFLTLWLKIKYGVDRADAGSAKIENKIDDNTKITKAGSAAAVTNAKAAAQSAEDAKTVAKSIQLKLNGGIDAAINDAVKPLQEQFENHVRQDELVWREIKTILTELNKKIK